MSDCNLKIMLLSLKWNLLLHKKDKKSKFQDCINEELKYPISWTKNTITHSIFQVFGKILLLQIVKYDYLIDVKLLLTKSIWYKYKNLYQGNTLIETKKNENYRLIHLTIYYWIIVISSRGSVRIRYWDDV